MDAPREVTRAPLQAGAQPAGTAIDRTCRRLPVTLGAAPDIYSVTMTTTEHDTKSSIASPTLDDSAFGEACVGAWASLVRYLRAISGAGQDVEELAGLTLETAWRRRATLVDAGGFTPWLLMIARHTASNGRRSANRRSFLIARLVGLRELRATHPSAHAELVRTEAGPATRALATLGVADREVIVLHAWEALEPVQIAEVLGISRDAAAQRLHRARRRLERALEMGEQR